MSHIYFVRLAKIWQAYFNGSLTMSERDKRIRAHAATEPYVPVPWRPPLIDMVALNPPTKQILTKVGKINL